MNEILLKSEEIDSIFKNHLKIESKVMSIESLFANLRLESKIIFDPYYQRNYVWDDNKASYFIESILLGTEIPPLVFFNNQKNIEIIDGRQRFETIKNFIKNKSVLSKNGLTKLKILENKNFLSLDSKIKEIFWDTKIRIIEFSIVNEPKLDEKKEDLIKKEIFRRYNSGITPLKSPEIDKAIYIDDELTKYFKNKFKINKEEYKTVLELFFNERDVELIDKRETLDKVMSRIRLLLVLNNIPIKRYSTLPGRNDILKQFYSLLSNNMGDVDDFYQQFNKKIELIVNLKQVLQNKSSGLFKNRLIYECTFWMLTILEKESKDVNVLVSPDYMSEYADYLIKENEKFSLENSHFYRNVNERYITVANYFTNKLGLKFNLFLDDYTEFKSKTIENSNSNNNTEEINNLEILRLNKPEPSSMTIEDICRQMTRNKFLVRPTYQRGEVINKTKSSALIESILLGIKIPPIFVYKRNDGIYELIDGQQRILSILGFLGEDFLNEDGKMVKSEKNNFKLNELRILSEFNEKKFIDLSQEFKNKILDFNLSVVIIDEKINPKFDKIDLFIRLNNKPYPIRDHSFEMWNSYIDKDIISKIKQNYKKNSSWFYLKTIQYNSRMDNEELYTSLVYLEYKKQKEKVKDITEARFLTIYQRENNINLRIKEKPDITKILNEVTINEKLKIEFIRSIENVELFIEKLKIILSDQNSDEVDEYLRVELNKLFSSKSTRRTAQSFYSLWIILNDVNLETIKKYRIELGIEVRQIFENMKNIQEEQDGLIKYKKLLSEFKDKYNSNELMIKSS